MQYPDLVEGAKQKAKRDASDHEGQARKAKAKDKKQDRLLKLHPSLQKMRKGKKTDGKGNKAKPNAKQTAPAPNSQGDSAGDSDATHAADDPDRTENDTSGSHAGGCCILQ
eukprot:scaffold6177_cov44-Prasinocladus_malaysianus.AAC.1